MYYFLAIVAENDLKNGIIQPSYVLCQSHGKATTRSGWRVAKQNSTLRNMTKVLVKTLHGNDQMIDFLSKYRTRDHMHGDTRYRHASTKKYYPKGALFWFPCNIYGDREGPAVYIKHVPEKSRGSDDGFQRLLESREQTISLSQVLSREPRCMDITESSVKPRFYQERIPGGSYKPIKI